MTIEATSTTSDDTGRVRICAGTNSSGALSSFDAPEVRITGYVINP
jgi:hypothetical protein